MRFLIDCLHTRMAVGNQVLPIDTSALASNIYFIAFDSATSGGGIQYNDRPGTLADITDPSPYQTYLNQWLTTAQTLTPPLQLADAISIKQAFVQTIYNIKLNAPLTATAAGHTWDVSDHGMTQLTAAALAELPATFNIAPLSSASFTNPLGAAKGAKPLSTSIVPSSSWIGWYIFDLTNAAHIDAGTTITAVNIVAQTVTMSVGAAAAIATNESFTVQQPQPAPTTALNTYPTGTYKPSWADITAILTAANTARTNLLNDYNTITANLAAALSIPAVIAFDVTAGWV